MYPYLTHCCTKQLFAPPCRCYLHLYCSPGGKLRYLLGLVCQGTTERNATLFWVGAVALTVLVCCLSHLVTFFSLLPTYFSILRDRFILNHPRNRSHKMKVRHPPPRSLFPALSPAPHGRFPSCLAFDFAICFFPFCAALALALRNRREAIALKGAPPRILPNNTPPLVGEVVRDRFVSYRLVSFSSALPCFALSRLISLSLRFVSGFHLC